MLGGRGCLLEVLRYTHDINVAMCSSDGIYGTDRDSEMVHQYC